MPFEYFKKSYPYICNSCGEFSNTLAEYCEKCRTKGSLREVKNFDYEEKNIDQKISSLSKEEAKKSLTYSLVAIAVSFLLFLLALNDPFSIISGIDFLLFLLIFLTVGIVSLILYFFNPEISYGMWISRKKSKNINNKNVIVGRRILQVIVIIGLCVSFFIFIRIINAISP